MEPAKDDDGDSGPAAVQESLAVVALAPGPRLPIVTVIQVVRQARARMVRSAQTRRTGTQAVAVTLIK